MMEKPSSGAGGGGGGEAKERKGLWSPEEDERLYTQITRHGVSTWSSVAQLAGLRRSGKSCRLRWMNYLRPDLKKEPISRREEETIVSLQKSLGNRWSVIAARMPGRTDNEIKNYWNSRIRKRQSATAGGGGKAGGCTNAAYAPAALAETTSELTPAAAETTQEPVSAAAPPPAPARLLPVFACQLPAGGGDAAAIAAAGTTTHTQSTTTHEQNGAGSESEVSVGNGGGEDAREEEHYYYCAGNGNGNGNGNGADMDMIHLLSFDDLEYPAGDLLLQLDDAWDQSQLYSANSWSS